MQGVNVKRSRMTSERVANCLVAMTMLALVCVLLVGCQSPESGRPTDQLANAGGGGTAAPSVQATDPAQDTPPQPIPVKPEPAASAQDSGALSKPELYYGVGSEQPAASSAPVEMEPGTGAVSLNFVDADIREAIETVLGQTLKVGYVIDPRIKGSVTLRTTKPLPSESVIGVLEDILAMNGAALTKAGDVYKIIPLEEASARPAIVGQGIAPVVMEQGFGLHVIPLRYVSAAALIDVVRPFTPPGRVIQADPQRNVLIFVGTGPESLQIADLIGTFDVDGMAGKSFGLFPVVHAKPQSIADELTKVFAAGGAQPSPGMVDLVPLDRLEAILVISRQPAYLDQARQWIARLDRGVASDARQLYVYFLQNGRAVDLAQSLGQVFGIAASVTGQATPQLAPGSTPTEISSPSGQTDANG